MTWSYQNFTHHNIPLWYTSSGQFLFHENRPQDSATGTKSKHAGGISCTCCYRGCTLTTRSSLLCPYLQKEQALIEKAE